MPDRVTFLYIASCFCLLCLFFPQTGLGEDRTLEQQLVRLQNHYRHLNSLSFTFSQLTRTGLRTREGAGNAIFLRLQETGRPGIMRWNYTTPDPQVLLNDGEKLSIYSARDRQVIITSAAELNNDITYAFFSGTRNPSEDFTVNAPEKRYGFALPGTELKALRLIPREPHPQIRAVQIWFDSDLLIRRLVLEDHFDSITELTFSNIKTNTLDPADPEQVKAILRLDLPPDTEVITQ